MIGNFLTLWCNEHFRKNKKFPINLSCSLSGSILPILWQDVPAQHPHLCVAFILPLTHQSVEPWEGSQHSHLLLPVSGPLCNKTGAPRYSCTGGMSFRPQDVWRTGQESRLPLNAIFACSLPQTSHRGIIFPFSNSFDEQQTLFIFSLLHTHTRTHTLVSLSPSLLRLPVWIPLSQCQRRWMWKSRPFLQTECVVCSPTDLFLNASVFERCFKALQFPFYLFVTANKGLRGIRREQLHLRYLACVLHGNLQLTWTWTNLQVSVKTSTTRNFSLVFEACHFFIFIRHSDKRFCLFQWTLS